MHPARKRKLMGLGLMAIVLAIASALVLYALRQNINLFYTPTQIANGDAPSQQVIRVGGMVVPGSIIRGDHDVSVAFDITDYAHTITVTYRGILPDLFREGQGIVALGQLSDHHRVLAIEVLAKHDENYMPPEVKEALKQVER
jgi:cytochrome c-type biogenesis protein CcmE